MFHIAKLRIFSEICVTIWLQKYFKVIEFEDIAVADFATLAGGKYLNVPPTSVKIVSQGDTISEFEYFAVCFPNGNIHRVAAIKHSASGSNMN